MIQRIQSVYLFLTFLLCALMFVLPMALFTIAQPGKHLLYEYNLAGMSDISTKASVDIKSTLYLQLMVIIMGSTALASVFLYKNRTLQFNITRINHLLSFMLVGALYFAIESDVKASYGADIVSVTYLPAGYFPPVILLLLFLAARAMRKDDDLVKSADRLR